MSRSSKLLSLMEAADLLRPVRVDDQIESQMIEWEKIHSDLEVLDTVAKKLTTRVIEAGSYLAAIIKTSAEQSLTMRSALETFQQRKSPSAAYQTAFMKAFEAANSSLRKSVEAYKAGCTSDDMMQAVKVVDPETEEHLQILRTTATDELPSKLEIVAAIPNKPMKIKEGFVDVVMKWINAAKHGLEKVSSAFSKSEKMVNKFLVIAKKEDEDSRPKGSFLTPPSEDEVW